MTPKILPADAVEKLIHETLRILQMTEKIPRMRDNSFDLYETICQKMPGQIRSGRLRIAVTGVIKSGKSTLVNSLVGKELVKRGAGVVTAMTTRIRKGRKNQACISFKSWDEINSQIQKALVLFPGQRIEALDIRRKKDREYLHKIFEELSHDFPVTTDGIRPETLLIRHALCGFDAVSDLVQADEASLYFEAKEFARHKKYTSDPNMAFYVKDVCLEVFGRTIDPNIEIADCQGTDSTDPSSLEQVLSYLESANLIIYCISSRTGIRQSDMTFLKQIKNAGLLGHIIFVNNCDLTEHENLDDLIKIETSIRDNLEFLGIQPIIFSFSCLYALFLKLSSKLNKKDSTRLTYWQKEKKMVEYCDQKIKEFTRFFLHAIEKNRQELLVANHLKRLGIIVEQVAQRADIFLDLLSSDRTKEEKAVKNLDNLYQDAFRLESIVANSIQGAVSGLTDEIQSAMEKVFIQDEKAIVKKTRDFIRTVHLDVEQYRSISGDSGFNKILYLIFQDFKRKLDGYVIENVNPRVKRFVVIQEDRIGDYFQSLFNSYQIDLLKPGRYSQLDDLPELPWDQKDFTASVDMDTIKKILGLQLPSQIFEARYTRGIKANILTGFCLKTLSQLLASLSNRNSRFSFSPALEKAAFKIKIENQKGIKDQFKNYHMRLKTHYFLPLIEAAAREFREKIKERFHRYHSFKQEMANIFSLQHAEKKDQKEKVYRIKQNLQKLADDIASCSENIMKIDSKTLMD